MIQTPHHILQSIFGYDQFHPYQEDIIQRVMQGENALVIMPTGGGKSLCYQIPALLRQGTGIVISPLISLMQDQVDALKQLGVKAAFLNSSLDREKQTHVESDFLGGKLDLLYVAPERLLMPNFIALLEQVPLALFAIDEAHCISQWGHDFRDDYLQLAEVRNRFPNVPCIATTATADDPTRREILERLHLANDDLIVTGFDRPNICYTVTLKKNTKQQLLKFIRERHSDDSGIVYCLSRKRVETFAQWLTEQGFEALPYHAGLSADIRQHNQDRFLHEEGLIVVATVAFGMGIDKPNVRFVAHVDLPKSPEAYYQETGRAGRDGLPSNAWMAYGLSDVVMLNKFTETSEASEQHKKVERHKLNAMLGFCETSSCRRQILLNYFGEIHNKACGNCDTCLTPVETWDGTIPAQKVLSCIFRTGQRFGASHIVDVLLGKPTDKIERFQHHELSTYGIGEELARSEWHSVIRQLVAKGLIYIDIDGYGGLQLTEACRPVLKGEEEVQFRKDPKPERKKIIASTPKVTLSSSPEDQDLFDALRDLRIELARKQGVPPYIIFHDATLIAFAQQRPQTHNELSYIPGVGETKLERYGDAFLSVIQQYAEPQALKET